MSSGDKRRLCIITGGHWAAVKGGAQYQAKTLVDELVKRGGLEIFYLARAVDPSYRPNGYKIIKIADPVGIRRYGFFFDAPRLLAALKEIKPDLIYQRGLQSYTGIAAYYAQSAGCQFIFHIAHDYDVSPFDVNAVGWNSPSKFIEKYIGSYGLKKADYIIAQTKRQVGLLKRHYGRTATAIIPNVHPLPIEKIQKQDRPLRVVWVANFKPEKRPEMFVQLAKDLQCLDDTEFIMIGRSGEQKLYRDLHKQIENTSNLRYLGEKPINEVNEIMAGAHLFVNTSVAEGFANTFIQAWMRKVPVVSAEVNSDGIFDDGAIGVCGKTYEGLLNAVKNLIQNDTLRKQMGENAYTYALRTHSISNAVKLLCLLRGKNDGSQEDFLE